MVGRAPDFGFAGDLHCCPVRRCACYFCSTVGGDRSLMEMWLLARSRCCW